MARLDDDAVTLTVRVLGVPEAEASLESLRAGVAAFGSARALVGTNVSYAKMHHDGTRPHTIEPATKKALFWRGAEHPVRRVHHPGTKANPFLAGALTDLRGQVREIVLGGLKAAHLAGGASVLVAALRTAGLLVQAEAMRRVGVKTGQLRASLHTEVFRGRQ